MSGFLLRLVRHQVPVACCEHLAGTAWLSSGAREGHPLSTPAGGRVTRYHRLSVSSCSLVPICGVLGCQDNNLYMSLPRTQAKTLLSAPPGGGITGGCGTLGDRVLAAPPLGQGLLAGRFVPSYNRLSMRLQQADRQGWALDVCVVAQAWQRDRGDAQPGKLLVGVHDVMLATGQGHRCPGSGQQLRHVGCPDGERARIHSQPPSSVLLPQASIDGWVGGVHQAGQAGDQQVAGGTLVS